MLRRRDSVPFGDKGGLFSFKNTDRFGGRSAEDDASDVGSGSRTNDVEELEVVEAGDVDASGLGIDGS